MGVIKKIGNMTTEDYVHSCLNHVSSPVLQHFINISLSNRLKNSKLDSILSYLLKNPNSTVTDVMEAKIDQIKHLSYETIHRYLNEDLMDTGLIEITRVVPMTNMKSKFIKYFRLSLNGLLYVIMNCSEDASGDLIQSIVNHYRTNIFFGIFLYPFIKEETLMALTPGWDIKVFLDLYIS